VADFVIVHGDMIMWMPTFGICTTLGPPTGMVIASAAKTKVTEKPVALQGDEMKWMSLPCGYTAGGFSVPGMGVAKVMMLGGDQTTKTTKVENKAAIIKGSNFMAVFMVMAPAMMPTPTGPVPDPMPMHMGGMGKFINSNTVVKAG
jgi:uncharacterized Zn-binding protein involved in type VI secretion